MRIEQSPFLFLLLSFFACFGLENLRLSRVFGHSDCINKAADCQDGDERFLFYALLFRAAGFFRAGERLICAVLFFLAIFRAVIDKKEKVIYNKSSNTARMRNF